MAVAAEAAAQIIPELESDEAVRRRAAEFIGAVATHDCVEAPTQVQPIESLHHAIQEAAQGNAQAREMVKTNVRTDIVERTMKAGHITEVDLMVDEAGRIQQHGQSLDSVQANSLRFAADSWQMRERVEAETRNAFRLQHHAESGDLEENYFVVFSRAADNMSQHAMRETGFFTDTMSIAIQVTGMKDGRLITETAFVAGVEEPSCERHDQAMVEHIGRRLGIDLTGLSATETLDTPALVPKDQAPNGAIDLVRMADEPRGTFFGQAKPQQDHLAYKEVCAERELRFGPKAEQITEQLISEASFIGTPVDAIQRLDKLSGRHMIDQAFGDTDIDPRVFGPIAAYQIEQGRIALEQGRYSDALDHANTAKANDQSDSCPGAAFKYSQESKNDSTSDEDCEFVSKKCPECGAKNVKTKVTKNKITGRCGCSKSK